MPDAFTDEVSPEGLKAARAALAGRVRRTPVVAWPEDDAALRFGARTELLLKLEVLQHASCFKTRGVLLHLLQLDAAARARGVIAASAGNHAVCVAFAARATGVSAQVVVPRTCSPARLDLCRQHGADVVLVDDIHAAFAEMERRREREGRVAIPSYDSPYMALGAGDLAAELDEEVGALDALVVAVGGGGLLGGAAAALHLLRPGCAVHGVEPAGADTMARSLESGSPQRLQGATIADSLAAPAPSDRTLALCRRFARGVVRVDDAAIRAALRPLFTTMKLAVEPAAAAALAGALGPLRDELRGKRVGVVVCGSHIEPRTYAELLCGP